MVEMLIVFCLPLILAVLQHKVRFDKVWAFFCSSLLAFFLTVSMLSYTVPVARKLLNQNTQLLPVFVFLICGALSTILLYLIFTLILRGTEKHFPDKVLLPVKLLLAYLGTLLQLVLLISGTISMIGHALPESQEKLMDATGMVTPRVMAVCGYPLTERQMKWLHHASMNSVQQQSVEKEEAGAFAQDDPPPAAPAPDTPMQKMRKNINTHNKQAGIPPVPEKK